MKNGKTERKTRGERRKRTKMGKRRTKSGKEASNVFVPRCPFHSGTPLVPRSTAEAASQSPFLVCPVTPHQRGQRALCLPINEPASASVPLSTPQTPTIQWETEMKHIAFSAAPHPERPANCFISTLLILQLTAVWIRICFHFIKPITNKRGCKLRVPLFPWW